MDRSAAMAGGAVLAMVSLWFGFQTMTGSPSPTIPSESSTEPAHLNLSGLAAHQLPAAAETVRPAGSFFSDDEEKALKNDSLFVTPEKLLPQLTTSKDALIELPSAKAEPAPINRDAETSAAPLTVEKTPPSASRLATPKKDPANEPTPARSPLTPDLRSPVITAVPPRSQRKTSKSANEGAWVNARPAKEPQPSVSPPEQLLPSPAEIAEVVEDSPALILTPAAPLRPAALNAAVTRAEQMTAEGLRLAQKGALFSARAQFLRALRNIAAAQDQVQATTQFTLALNSALRAMSESHDFELQRAITTEPVNVQRVVAGHRTETLKLEDVSAMTPAAARDRYQQLAVEQLTFACGGESAISMPLYGLGRVSAVSGKANAAFDVYGSSDALVWFHAAMMTDPRNFRAAHELGSLYAKRGEWEPARAVLQRAIGIQSNPTTWANLAVVHAKLGETEWVAAAQSRAGGPAAPEAASSNLPPIEWVNPETFAKSTAPNEVHFPQQAQPPVATQPAPPEPRSAAKPKFSTSWLPWKISKPR